MMWRGALEKDNQQSTFAHTHQPKPLNHFTVVPHPLSPLLNSTYIFKHDLERFYNKPVPLVRLTDSNQEFDVINQETHSSRKREIIDVEATREA